MIERVGIVITKKCWSGIKADKNTVSILPTYIGSVAENKIYSSDFKQKEIYHRALSG